MLCHKSYVIITLFLGLPLWDALYYVTTTFFQVSRKRILHNIRNTLFTGTLQKYDTITLRVGSSFVWYVCITYWNNVTATFRFCLSLWHTFIISQLHYIFVERVAFSPDVRIKLNYWNCRNVWTVYGSYVLKWLYFSYIIFLAHLLFDNLKITLIVVYLH